MPAKSALPMRESPEPEQQQVSAGEASEPRNAARDGTALARAQREAEEARHAVELQERLVGVVGHDLRTPLAAIQMGIALLLRKGGLSPDQERTVGRLGASAGRMTAIIRDLLDFTRVRKEGAIPLEPKPVDLAEVCRRAVTELRQAHPNRGIALATPPAIPLVGDPERLLQVASNLVGNAIQHSPPESEVVVRLIASAAEAILEVHNDGAPIPAELLPDLFEPFRQAVRGPDPTGSIGLGLFIVRALVDAHGGRVEARSTSDEGTTFTVRLPRGA
jgi:signal transduction histidine kinase